jgi:hypothetical protein
MKKPNSNWVRAEQISREHNIPRERVITLARQKRIPSVKIAKGYTFDRLALANHPALENAALQAKAGQP